MFRALCFVMALILYVSAWSTAQAAVMARPAVRWLWKEGTIYFNPPLKVKLPGRGVYEKEKINIPSLREAADTTTAVGKAVAILGAAVGIPCGMIAWCRNRFMTKPNATATDSETARSRSYD